MMWCELYGVLFVFVVCLMLVDVGGSVVDSVYVFVVCGVSVR